MGKIRRGMVAGRKLRRLWIMQRWWSHKQVKRIESYEWKKPYTCSNCCFHAGIGRTVGDIPGVRF